MENNQQVTPEAKAPEQKQVTPEAKAPEQKKQKAKSNPVELGLYQRFAALKSLDIDEGTKLTEETTKTLEGLEKEVKSCTGSIAKKTVTAAIGNEVVKLYEGFPIPSEYEKLIKEAKAEKIYFK